MELPDLAAQPGTTVNLVSTVWDELVSVGREKTWLGMLAMEMAVRAQTSHAVMGYAALVKELRATVDAAMAGAQKASDPVDELKARRDQILGKPAKRARGHR